MPESAMREASSIRPDHAVRAAEPRDIDAIVRLIRGLAEFEKLTHLLRVTPETLAPHLFGPRPAAEALVAERHGTVVGFALFFTNFSTFLAQPGLYLEGPVRRAGGARPRRRQVAARALARLAVARGCGRFEWSVLDWNVDAIRFYERMGATVMPDWRICRVSGPALETFGADAGA
jgi:GNAT superfamily N-acetyltransferase